jgi:hypothetical protein
LASAVVSALSRDDWRTPMANKHPKHDLAISSDRMLEIP